MKNLNVFSLLFHVYFLEMAILMCDINEEIWNLLWRYLINFFYEFSVACIARHFIRLENTATFKDGYAVC